jgi:DNA-binding LacI/PurR family transcriptional regulator
MQEAGLAIDPAWIVRGEGEYNYGHTATPLLLDLPANRRPTAIVTMMDLIAIGVLHAVQMRGLKVGQDIAVTGFDDVPVIQYFKPSLTTLRQPIWEVGRRAVKLLVDLLQGETVEKQQILLAPQLIIRESTQSGEPVNERQS